MPRVKPRGKPLDLPFYPKGVVHTDLAGLLACESLWPPPSQLFRQWLAGGNFFAYSGGTAPDLHRFPY